MCMAFFSIFAVFAFIIIMVAAEILSAASMCILFIAAVTAVVYQRCSEKKSGIIKMSAYVKDNILVICFVAAAFAVWLYNRGAVRIVLCFPAFYHAAVFVAVNFICNKYNYSCWEVRRESMWCNITFLLAHILLGDTDSDGGRYALFRLVHNDTAVNVFTLFASAMFIVNIFILILRNITVYKQKRIMKLRTTYSKWLAGKDDNIDAGRDDTCEKDT